VHAVAVALVVVHGLVLRGPTKPVCSMPEPCDEPAAKVQLVFSHGRSTVRVRTDRTGHYRVRLAPGRYTLHVKRIQPGALEVHRAMRADFFIDTGIR
jgi:hypothetical protein